MSELDIDKGERWGSVLAEVLGSAKVGIFCLTPANVTRPALLFEAGAISKSVAEGRACVLLDGMQSPDLSWPWSQFQATKLQDQKDMFKMLSDLNRCLTEASEPALSAEQFTKQLGIWWPEFRKELSAKPPEANVRIPERTEKDMLVEILDLLRSQKRESDRMPTTIEMLMDDLAKARAVAQQELQELRHDLTVARRNETRVARLPVQVAMAAALGSEGHETASAVLSQSSLHLSSDGTCIVVAPLRPSMAALTFNAEAERIMLDAAKSAGYDVRAIAVRAAPQAKPLPGSAEAK